MTSTSDNCSFIWHSWRTNQQSEKPDILKYCVQNIAVASASKVFEFLSPSRKQSKNLTWENIKDLWVEDQVLPYHRQATAASLVELYWTNSLQGICGLIFKDVLSLSNLKLHPGILATRKIETETQCPVNVFHTDNWNWLHVAFLLCCKTIAYALYIYIP